MSLIQLIIVIAVVGLLLYVVNQYVPMEAKIKQILNIVVILFLVLWLLSEFLPAFGFHDIRIGK